MAQNGGERENPETMVQRRCCTPRDAGRLYAVAYVEARTLSQTSCEEAEYRLGGAEALRTPLLG